MRCPACQADNRADRSFCADCGAALAIRCPACQFANQPGEKFCGGCGAALVAPALAPSGAPSYAPPAEGERRQVTVLFADLTGFSELTRELGAEAVHALTGRFFERVDGVIEGYGGTIDKHIGDCVMAVFGAPLAHGNDHERAVRAALEIRAALPELSGELGHDIGAHIGIASGQVVASGGAGHRSYSITGESVNLASRLTAAAAPGVILIADGVRAMLAERLECRPLGRLAVKGFAEPVQAWRLEGLRQPDHPSGRPFVGRRADLGQFEAILRACLESGAGHAIHLRGEAGIGKTRVVEEFQRRAAAAGFACHTGLVLDFGAGTGRDAIRALARSLLGAGGGSARSALEAAAERALADGLVSADRRVYLHDLLDLAQPTELRALYDAMDNAARNRGKRQTIAALVQAASRQRPILLVVEDLHWADRPTLDHLASLTETAAVCPAILVMTSRIEGDPLDSAWRSRLGGSPLLTIDLGPLRPQEATRLAEAYLAANSDFTRRCVERAAGNPLFLEQLLRHAEDNSEAGVPGSVQSLVQARMDQLEPIDKQALQAASILGQRFSLDVLRHLTLDQSYACTGLIARFLVRPQDDDFLFAHALIRDGVYDSLLQRRRRELHRRAADWFAGRDLVLHAEHLGRAGDAAAPLAYLEAARAQATEYRTERALRLVERGLALAGERPDVYALTRFEGEILHDLGAIPESVAAFERALAVAEAEVERCGAWLGLAAGMRMLDRLDEAFAALDQAEATASAAGLEAELARAHHLRGNLCFPLGRLQECQRAHELALDLARKASAPELEARALGGLGDAEYARGRMRSAHGHFSRCVALSRAHGFGRVEVANLTMVGHMEAYLHDLQAALATSLAAIELAARVGHHRAEVVAQHGASRVLCMMGDFEPAKAHAERALALVQRLGVRRFEPVSLNEQAMILRGEGCRGEALDVLHRALAISRETGISFVGPWLLGHLAVTTEDPAERRAALAEGEEVLGKGAVSHNHLWFYCYAMQAALAAGEYDAAEHYAAALEEYTRPEPFPWAEFFIAYGRALARHGRGWRDPATLRELRRLDREARRVGLRIALPALERALGSSL
jgi:class 3 adenylate cyclase/tetratricopeptide (TPR) repeat protein